MKKTIKNVACAALCAVLLFCMYVPAFADRSTYFAHTTMHNGAQVYRQGSLSGATVTASISLTFVSGVAHLPVSDYSCGIRVEGKNLNGSIIWSREVKSASMYCSISTDGSSKPVLPKATCKFYLDPDMSPTNPLSNQIQDYTDELSI